jgi:nucleoside-diphosphate-sugar epimerase
MAVTTLLRSSVGFQAEFMRSAVIGATGIVGGHIVNHLVSRGERPIALSRSIRSSTMNVEWFEGDLNAPEKLELPAISTLYCTANVGLLAVALPYFPRDQLTRAVAFTSTSIITKAESELRSERESVRLWAESERQFILACERLGIQWTILRPTLIYDEGRDANVTRLSRLIEKIGFMPLAGAGSGLRQPVHAEDLALGAIAAAASSDAKNKIYALAGTDTITYREMVGRIFDGMQRSRRIVAIPAPLWRAAFALTAPFISNANVAMGNRMSIDMIFDVAPAVKDFGWNPREFRPKFK